MSLFFAYPRVSGAHGALVAGIMRQSMQEVIVDVPIQVESYIGHNWAEMQPVHVGACQVIAHAAYRLYPDNRQIQEGKDRIMVRGERPRNPV